METVFSKIIKKEIPAYIIYEDDLVLSFLDINPEAPGHALVIPKAYAKDILELDEHTASHLFKVVTLLSKKISNILGSNGIKLVSNNGVLAGQSVFHFHMHIIPSYKTKLSLDIKEIHYKLIKY